MYAARLRSQVDLERQSVGMLGQNSAVTTRSQQEIKMDALKYELQEETRKGARIKVIGIGGGGSNAVGRMYEEGLDGVEFYVMNTDAQALEASRVPNKIQIGARVTEGLGAGSDPAIGRQAALEDTERILSILEGADLVFITAGLGGGTGAGAAPVVATLAKQLDALTIAIVTKPFTFEGGKRMRQAERSVNDLASSVDILTTIPNDRLLTIAPQGHQHGAGVPNGGRRAAPGRAGHQRDYSDAGPDQSGFLGHQGGDLGDGACADRQCRGAGSERGGRGGAGGHQFAASRRHEDQGRAPGADEYHGVAARSACTN